MSRAVSNAQRIEHAQCVRNQLTRFGRLARKAALAVVDEVGAGM